MRAITKSTLIVCKEKLLMTKASLLNRIRDNYNNYTSRDRNGDETDQAVNVLEENQFLSSQDRLRALLLDVEMALAKIELGQYGICEETEEPIEIDRLLAIPWTRFSIEGAEIREDMSKRFAK